DRAARIVASRVGKAAVQRSGDVRSVVSAHVRGAAGVIGIGLDGPDDRTGSPVGSDDGCRAGDPGRLRGRVRRSGWELSAGQWKGFHVVRGAPEVHGVVAE